MDLIIVLRIMGIMVVWWKISFCITHCCGGWNVETPWWDHYRVVYCRWSLRYSVGVMVGVVWMDL